MSTPELREEYRRIRASDPYIPARIALVWAREALRIDDIPDWIPCTTLLASRGIERDGLVFRFEAERDADADCEMVGLGRWTDQGGEDLRDGYVDRKRHDPKMGRGEYRWWQSEMSAEEHAQSYHAQGMAKGPAHDLGVARLLEEYQNASRVADGSEPIYLLMVTVYTPDGRELAGASLGGMVPTADLDAWHRYVRETFHDLTLEAAEEARELLAEEAAEERARERRERALALVGQAAQGEDIAAQAALLVAEEAADAASEGVTG